MLISRCLTALAVSFGIAAVGLAQSANNVSSAARDARLQLLLENPNAKAFMNGGDVLRIYGNIPMPGATAEDTAVAFMNMYAEAFGSYPQDLVLQKKNSINFDMEVFWFAQVWKGLPVEGSGLTVLISKGLPNSVVLVSPKVRPVPTNSNISITAQTAVNIVRSNFRQGQYFTKPEMMVWGYDEVGHLAYMVEAGTKSLTKPERYMFFVDANGGTILEKRSEVYFADVSGTLTGKATPSNGYPDEASNAPTVQNLVGRGRVVGGNFAYANANGQFTITNAGTTAVNVEGALIGQWVRVVNNAGANELQTVNVTPPGPANILMNPTPTGAVTAQVNGLVQTDIVHNYAKAINPAYPGIDIQIPCNVNIADTCNAFYSNNTINFFSAGGGCANTAYSSVVHHEYGHFIIAHGHNNPSGAYHEGVADTGAILLADDPILGHNFSGPGSNVRNADSPNVLYPCNGEAHQCGLVIAGAFWDTLTRLKSSMGVAAALTHARYLYLNQILMSPAIDPGITIDVLTLDDAVSVGGNANINDGSPHYQDINSGFTQHNLDGPHIPWITIKTYPGDLSVMPPNVPIRFSVQVNKSLDSYLPGTTVLFYKTNFAPVYLPVYVPDVSENPFDLHTATIPAQPAGTVIEWYLQAQTDGIHTQTDVPANAPHVSIVGSSTVTVLNDSFNTDLGWTITNTNVTTGQWGRAIPATPTRGEPNGAHTPSWCMVTDNRVGDFDVDGGPTVATSPAFDLSTNGLISLAYYMHDSGLQDDLTLQISNNGGASWVTVATWPSSDAWNTYSFAASKYVVPTSNMKIRLSVVDAGTASVVEAGLDTVLIRRIQ